MVTRFPPEPNGYLHLGHAKSINFNFAVAKHFKGVTHMRFDDTNPAKENMEYVNSILNDVRWLVQDKTNPASNATADPWFGDVRYASDYFPVIYNSAEYLIKQGLAYVDELSPGLLFTMELQLNLRTNITKQVYLSFCFCIYRGCQTISRNSNRAWS